MAGKERFEDAQSIYEDALDSVSIKFVAVEFKINWLPKLPAAPISAGRIPNFNILPNGRVKGYDAHHALKF